jgi:hypothetical protein
MFLSDFAEFNVGRKVATAIGNNPGKSILAGSALVGAGAVGGSYLNKKDKRTLRQRVTDVSTYIVPAGLITAGAHSNATGRLISKAGRKYGKKGLIGATAGGVGAIVAGTVAGQQLRRKHADNTQKRKKGQRLAPVDVNMLGLKYKEYPVMNVR